MSITLLSQEQIRKLRNLMREKGWKINGLIGNNYRYSFKQNKFSLFSSRYPIHLPFKLNIPFEIINFKIGLAFKYWNLDRKSLELLKKVMEMLRNFVEQASLNIKLPVMDKKKKLVDLLNMVIPEVYQTEKENAWINRIRISLMNKRNKIGELGENIITALGKQLKEIGLKPTFRLPWELENGIPKLRTSETLFFSTNEPFDEFFILEKGFFTYLKDIQFKKFYIRSCFESYTPYILHALFNSEELLCNLVKNWIKFARLSLNWILEKINTLDINNQSLRPFDQKRELTNKKTFVEEENNFPFSALHYESSIAKELYPIHHNLLNTPPNNYKVIENLNLITQAESLINNYKLKNANEVLTKALKIFNKYKQRKAVVKILLLLKKIALMLNQNETAINYLKNALKIAKSGKINVSYVVKIHYQLGKIHFELEFLSVAKQYFEVISNFIEKKNYSFPKKDKYLGLCYIYLGLIYQESENIAKSTKAFKKAFAYAKNSMTVKLKYHLLRAQYYKKQGKLSQAQKMLKMSIKNIDFDSIEKKNYPLLADLYLELSEYYIFDRKSSKNANYYLSQTKRFLNGKTIGGIKRSVRWNQLISAFFKHLIKNNEKASYYQKESRKFQRQLDIALNKE
jgi:tetratricopeptide (TPR) repeat protein